MWLQRIRRFLLVGLLLGVVFPASAQQVIYFENFEGGPGGVRIDKIKRYPMNPEIVSSDPIFPAAFPPPSGRFAVRAHDKSKTFYGLGSVVGGPVIDLNNPQFRYAAIEARIFLDEAPGRSDIANNALIAVDDTGATERYYRFGHARDSIYFHYFNASNFTESQYDPELASGLAIPGWHTLTMRFDGPGKIYFYVDGRQTFFSPVEQNDVTRFRMGVLGWDRYESRPIIADDFKVMLYSSPPSGQGSGSVSVPGKTSPMVPFVRTDTLPAVSSTPLTWYTDTNRAVQLAQSSGKKFLVFFHLPGHSKTSEMERGVFSDPTTRATLQKFILVKLDGRVNKPLTERYGVYKYPTLVVIDMQGRIYWEYRGVIQPTDLNRSLARF